MSFQNHGKNLKGKIMESKNQIKELRISAGLTQTQFAESFGIPIDVVKSWDSGRRTPPEWVKKLIIDELERIKNHM